MKLPAVVWLAMVYYNATITFYGPQTSPTAIFTSLTVAILASFRHLHFYRQSDVAEEFHIIYIHEIRTRRIEVSTQKIYQNEVLRKGSKTRMGHHLIRWIPHAVDSSIYRVPHCLLLPTWSPSWSSPHSEPALLPRTPGSLSFYYYSKYHTLPTTSLLHRT